MSIIGSFGLCPQTQYTALMELIQNGQFAEADAVVKEIYGELLHSASALESGRCSGETFLPLFEYLKTAHGIDLRGGEAQKQLGEVWRTSTGDFDLLVFSEEEKAQLLPLARKINADELNQFVSDFFAQDYGDAGQIACQALLDNLGKLPPDSVLLWHLC